jgi:hypothetical protein
MSTTSESNPFLNPIHLAQRDIIIFAVIDGEHPIPKLGEVLEVCRDAGGVSASFANMVPQ